MFNLIIKIMPYLILFFLLAIAIVVIIVIVTRASMRNKYSAEIRTLMEITSEPDPRRQRRPVRLQNRINESL